MNEKLRPRAPDRRRRKDAGRLSVAVSAVQGLGGLSQSLLAMIASGNRQVTDDVEDKVVAALGKIARLGKTAAKLEEIQGRILAAGEP
jgi:hypothetical protein